MSTRDQDVPTRASDATNVGKGVRESVATPEDGPTDEPIDEPMDDTVELAPANDPDLGEVVVSEEEIQQRIKELGARITEDYTGRPPLLVGVLKGAFVFMSDLARAISLPVEFDFMAVASYGSSTRTSGVVRIVKDLDTDLAGRHVLLVEDIVDSGLTLAFLMRNLAARNPASLSVCALLVKELEPTVPQPAYVGFQIPRDFVVGYGLDISERYRNLRAVHRYNGPW